jgi:tetratricopeptide (TPR) repeat protein
MRRLSVPLIGALLLLGATPARPDDLAKLLAELRRSDGARYGCFGKEPSILGSDDADAVVLAYQRSRALANAGSARTLLASLIEYALRPSAAAFQRVRLALSKAGATEPAAEDVCRCLYFEGGDERPGLMASLPPPALGLFLAARVLHESGRSDEAADYYRRSLELDKPNPRTRLLYAIALIDEQRAGEAIRVLAEVPPTWAPAPVAYWSARGLIEIGDAAGARRLLAPLRGGWPDAPTVPEAWINAGPVQPSSPPVCLLGRAIAEDGDAAEARALLEQEKECRIELGRLELRQRRPFEALLALEGHNPDDALLLEALSQLNACEWALGDLRGWQESCCADHRPPECALLRKTEREVLAACPRPAEQTAPGYGAALETRLEAPRLVAFEERRVSPEHRWAGKRPREARSAKSYPDLADLTIAALSPAAERMIAVSVSHDLDPRGEVSAGGYWLHLSADRGKTWASPHYLGIADQFPYVILPVTRVPAFGGSRVNVEVERREVDESTITFPPVGLRARNVQKDLYLSIDVAAVERDSDGDGLTDLLEEKLALDPRSPDSDGDGTPDGSDPLPLQPRSAAESSERGQLLEAVLPYLFGGPTPIQQTAAGGKETSAMYAQPRPFASARTLFISGDGAVLPHSAGVRAVMLPPAVLEQYWQKFGATYPMALPDIAFDQGRQRALIRYDFGWRGGSLLAERKDGRWTITPRGSWIS